MILRVLKGRNWFQGFSKRNGMPFRPTSSAAFLYVKVTKTVFYVDTNVMNTYYEVEYVHFIDNLRNSVIHNSYESYFMVIQFISVTGLWFDMDEMFIARK